VLAGDAFVLAMLVVLISGAAFVQWRGERE